MQHALVELFLHCVVVVCGGSIHCMLHICGGDGGSNGGSVMVLIIHS